MPNELILIDGLMQKHQAIRGHLLSICSMMDCLQDDCWENLKSANPEQIEILQQRQLNLRQAMGYLDEGLKAHHTEEEGMLPMLIGIPLFEAIRIEHDEMLKQLHEVQYALNKVSAQGFLENSSYIKMIIDNLCQLINNNTADEDVILRILKRRFI